MKKLLLILLVTLASCAAPKKCCSQDITTETLKEFFKFGTFYGAVNGGTSLSDVDVFSIETGQLTQEVIETPYDYSVIFGVRKMKQFGYQPKEAFKRGLESSFSDAATIGRWNNKLEFLFEIDYKRQEGVDYVNQHHFVRYVADKWVSKVEYLEDGFADIKYFEASERFRLQIGKAGKLSVNVGAVQRLAEPYGFDPLADWVLDNGTLHYTYLALQEGYTITLDGQYSAPNGEVVATSQEVWEEVVIPQVINNYVEKQRSSISSKDPGRISRLLLLICALAKMLLVCASTLEACEIIIPVYSLFLYARNFALTFSPCFKTPAKTSGICKSQSIFLESSSVTIMESVPKIEELIPLVPIVPENGAVIVLS